MAEFVRVAALEDLPADTGHVVRTGGRELALFRCGDSVYAMENICPHREGPIGEGWLENCIVSCPWHAWEIDVRTGAVVDDPEMRSATFPVEVRSGDVYVAV